MFLYNMVEHNPSNKIVKSLIVFYLYYGGLEYICMREKLYNYVLKNGNIFQK